MAHLVRIGNSQGVRIPKPLIEQAHLEGKELKFEVLNGGLFIAPIQEARQGWAKSINTILATHGEELNDSEWLDAKLTNDDELEW
ncbi:antitoxin MazE [Bathymodiolus platifrons methanotrophic gill symbiont]|uniref:AbrB/MazE/SpoVT family DNA-binding domain-containing protein n=1 Tax=Bathymodiolus platifrons methanotrophic gill symbiont TaxID=113268 RepID=UPI0011C9D273|nr:AbrB/MazE/SpoVT family DNA-binding domain-containing protein [Bathymodiolus platifrons methanotrophic gill symbiont]TXK92879.1 AbrB family transcriptional regulator [Methylococcaceae bacterium CS4]TXK97653.1 AbrB family transcriptional regulator [Methylococcaceae bacterium CS5]TXK98498.1 AbrB family transcriptional regulator [Methylococcaceae bacterium HT1]TXL02351.1 AbrB family transcriptional regulator [Methylococcaceae bacterium CS1]TXL02782.1 AbrB family transcriptional regulator [Methy